MFDRPALQAAVAAHGRVARLVIADIAGSSPREIGTAMLVWADGIAGTIGGGALEWAAIARARALLATGGRRLDRDALGPQLGQCCGGVITLVTEVYDADLVAALTEQMVVARPVTDRAGEMPLAMRRLVAAARNQGVPPAPALIGGWLIEPVQRARRPLWIWGAGHVGRALVAVLAPLPDFAITWIDTARARFPDEIPVGVTPVWAADPAPLADHAPAEGEHLIVTYSHALDLELCHRLLTRGDFAFLGLIGSRTKGRRFAQRLARLGHTPAAIDRLTTPIGDVTLGKHPQAIAIGVAVQLLKYKEKSETEIADDNRDGGSITHRGGDQGLSRRHRQQRGVADDPRGGNPRAAG